MLVMSAPTVDITNIDTSNVAQKDIYQQKVITSCNNMFNIAQKSLDQNPNLTKVVIMEHIPRFDNDPSSLKPDLPRLANVTLGQLWLNSPLKHKIFIKSLLVATVWRVLGLAQLTLQDMRTGTQEGMMGSISMARLGVRITPTV